MGKYLHIFLILLAGAFGLAPQAQAEDFLFGAAAVTAATSAMVVPAIMAQGQVNVAQTQANTATTISAMNAQTALFQAQVQSFTALAQAGVSRDIAMMNQQANTNNLIAQLQYLSYNRAIDMQMQRDRMANEMALQSRLMNLEYKKMELAQILAETNQISGGGLQLATTPNINNLLQNGAMTPNPAAGALGATALSQASNPTNSYGGAQSTAGLRRALQSSISSGSTPQRAFNSDLAAFRNSTLNAATNEDQARYESRAVARSLASPRRARTH